MKNRAGTDLKYVFKHDVSAESMPENAIADEYHVRKKRIQNYHPLLGNSVSLVRSLKNTLKRIMLNFHR